MKRLLTSVFVIGMAFCGAAATLGGEPISTRASDKQAVLQADHGLEQALMNQNKASAKVLADRLLDADFTWTDAAGKTSTRAQVLQSIDAGKAFTFGDGAGTPPVNKVIYAYEKVGVVQANVGRMHVLRVWVKRPAGWQALVYHEVKSLEAPPTSAPPGMGQACDNPCKTIPYEPKNDAEKGVVTAYMGLESSALAHDVPEWSGHVAEEFVVASSNSDRVLDKPTRIEGLQHEKMAGVAPTPLLTARMFALGDAVVMTSVHQPTGGKALRVTRVWIMRDGKWLETLSYQTTVQAPPVAPSN